MPFNWEAIGSGAATGILGAILVVLGWGRRIDALEENKADRSALSAIDTLVADNKEELRYLRHRIDEIYAKVVHK